MINQYLKLNDTQMNIKKSENLLAIIEDKRKNKDTSLEMKSENALFSDLFAAFKDFFSKLGKPTLAKRIVKEGEPARSSDYNKTMQEIYDDINVAYAETDSLSSVVVKDFNYSEAERQNLLNKVRALSSATTDYSFYSTGAKTQSIFAIDDFVDNTKIDFGKVSPGVAAAELVTNQGLVTLKRSGNVDRNPLVEKVTGIKDSIMPWSPEGEIGGYEGLYFGMKNEPRPEGGQWNAQYSANGNAIYEYGANEDSKMPIRLRMFDNNPDTFWEVEICTGAVIGYKDRYTGKQISVSEFNELVNNDVNSVNAVSTGGTVVTNDSGSLVESYVPISGTSSSDYLTCSIVVSLSNTTVLNWISLNPYNFGQELYLEVLSIQTSPDSTTYKELDGFDDHEFETMLTKEANSELTPTEVQDTLSPDQFKYAGQGVWVFAPRKVKTIKFTFRQMRSYLKPYDVLVCSVEQTVTSVTKTVKYWGLSKGSSTDTQVVTKDIEIPYLVGHIIGFDAMSLEAGADLGTEKSKNPIKELARDMDVVTPLGILTPITGPILAMTYIVAGIYEFFAGSKKTSTTVSPQRITKQWTKTKNDRSRFAIGVRDINLYSYKFAQSSEIVSKPYTSPAPIYKVALQVEEQIPTIFFSEASRAGTDNDWIKYYVSVDNGAGWHRISPTSHRTTLSEDGNNPVPEIITINSELPVAERGNPLAYIDSAEDIYTVRFKAVLSRPTDIQDAESYTPVLFKYSLQIYPLGGL